MYVKRSHHFNLEPTDLRHDNLCEFASAMYKSWINSQHPIEIAGKSGAAVTLILLRNIGQPGCLAALDLAAYADIPTIPQKKGDAGWILRPGMKERAEAEALALVEKEQKEKKRKRMSKQAEKKRNNKVQRAARRRRLKLITISFFLTLASRYEV